ncbi:MAG: hypothetical protein HQK83_06365 [Fibrobacteria bacterium]|nr:hypothetical protein [Fibrobacteria bacterium]
MPAASSTKGTSATVSDSTAVLPEVPLQVAVCSVQVTPPSTEYSAFALETSSPWAD